ncbi:ras-specific guanine nucleotide-releasing factor 2-like isoform X2 [Rhopilema esculentum]|uniref:ras-specific guanine nucleotide-releasing factor 2-like isoform X2 n=1 Tax=Rhopilema esculentum TaxID=499914 RepID=UPI0031DD3C4E
MPSSQVKLNEQQLIYLAEKAKNNAAKSGNLWVKLADASTTKWNLRYFVLHMNFLFEFHNQDSPKPSNTFLLEQCQFERTGMKNIHDVEHQFCFCILVPGVTSCQKITLRAENENDCTVWYQKITQSSYALLQTKKEDFEHKYSHVVQILESERAGAWQLLQQCQDQAHQLKDLRQEIAGFRKREIQVNVAVKETDDNETEEIKKVQSIFRGLLCRRRWHNIVQDYIRSPHAQSMRKRNQIVFELVRSEEEYLQTLSTLVTSFFRPLKMAASSKKPPLSHEEVNSIFLNSETLMFLHQIFFNGLQTRMESWPTLVLGDLFDMLLPMLSIYQEYVRNHHYSLQTLADCKQRDAFRRVLKVHEERPPCVGRTLENFLTIPMYRIPNYIITLHQLVSLTPPDHVERKSLEHAQSVLEELSTVMQDEVSETENIRRNLSIERQFAEGCEELLDVDQIFIRQGPLLQVGGNEFQANRRKSFSTLSLKSHDRKDSIRQCFLFSKCLLVTSRASNGKLQIVPNGKTDLQNTTLVEDVVDEDIDFVSLPSASEGGNLVFKLVVNHPDDSQSLKLMFLAASSEDKASWASDISQCIENLKSPETEHAVSITSRQSLLSIRSDARLFTNDQDIKYSKALDSSRLPRIQYGSVERLLERLIDVRFLSVEFLNTYLTTYRVFSDAIVLFDTLLQWYYTKAQFEYPKADLQQELPTKPTEFSPKVASHRNSCPSAVSSSFHYDMRSRRLRTHRHSAIPFTRDLKSPTTLYPPTVLSNRRHSSPSALYEEAAFTFPVRTSPQTYRYDLSGSPGEKHRIRSTSGPSLSESDSCQETYNESIEVSGNDKGSKDSVSLANKGSGGDLKNADLEPINEPGCPTSAFTRIQEADSERVPVLKLDSPPKMKKRDSKRRGSSCEIYTNTCTTGERTDSSALTVSESPSIDRQYRDSDTIISTVGVTVTPATSPISNSPPEGFKGFWREFSCESASSRDSSSSNFKQEIGGSHSRSQHPFEQSITIKKKPGGRYETVFDAVLSPSPPSPSPRNSPRTSPLTPPRSPGRRSPQTPRSPIMRFKTGKDKFPELRSSEFGRTSPFEALRSPTFNRSPNSSPPSPAPGVVVTSHRSSRRRSSISSAAVAFAAATAGASVSPAASPTSASRFRFGFNFQFSENMDGHIVTMRVLKILKHWISKQIEDFKTNDELRKKANDFLKEVLDSDDSSQAECKAAKALLKTLQSDESEERKTAQMLILLPTVSERTKSGSPIAEKFSTLQLAEQLTYIHHTLLSIIPAREFLDTAWMKDDKDVAAPNILRVINNFNMTSRLIASDILSKQSASLRAGAIEKWAVVADVCRCMHNFNGLLAVITSFTSSAVYRLKKTWEKVSKQTRILLEKLQSIVSAEGRFRNMREALRSCDPPCVPYLGYYLTDLAFIEEGTPNFNDAGLINFSKMRMIANVIQEIRSYQQTPYKIKPDEKVIAYLVGSDSATTDEELYQLSLQLEPRRRGSSSRSQRPGVTFI